MSDQDSLALYQYICQDIVGSEETVKTKRLLLAINDNLSFDKNVARITSGSFGEGLEMKGSDVDFMYVMKYFEVHENIHEIQWNVFGTYFKVITEDTKLGFVKLLLFYNPNIVKFCLEYEGNLYLSNQRMKSLLKGNMTGGIATDYVTEVNHGPCLSDRAGLLDSAISVHMKSWTSEATHWTTRPNSAWPSDDVKSDIIRHGVLFVPIGVKGSPNEEIEWRMSFSVGEKLLINSFTHTQLICYALMKIALKDIINENLKCKDLLCSYFIKNIMFWVSEELPVSFWKPYNLAQCFMQCFKRLMYCVQYSICPHYFIPENNMFENKIQGQSRNVLVDQLNTLYDLHWKFVLFSPQLHDFQRIPFVRYTESELFTSYFEKMNLSNVLNFTVSPQDTHNQFYYNRFIKMMLAYKSPNIKSYHRYLISKIGQYKASSFNLNDSNNNRIIYKNYRLCQAYLLQGTNHDAVTGWLLLTSLFYRIKQYIRTLNILHYALSKCSQEKILLSSKLSSAQHEILKSKALQSTGLMNVLKYLQLRDVFFELNKTLVPKELELETTLSILYIPPVVYAHFLSFLCHFHLRDARETRNSLEDLQITISEEFFIRVASEKSISYHCLGIALQLLGDGELARQAFKNAIKWDPVGIYRSFARMRLCLMDAD